MIRTESRFSFFLKFPLWQFVTTQTQRKLFIGCWRPRPFPQSQSRLHDLYREVIIPSSFCSWPIIELLCSIGTAILISGRGSPDVLQTPVRIRRELLNPGPGGATTHTETNTTAPDAAVWRCSWAGGGRCIMSSTATYSVVCSSSQTTTTQRHPFFILF